MKVSCEWHPEEEGKGRKFTRSFCSVVLGTAVEADLERAQKEIEQLKTDHEVSMERKDKEVGKST